MQDPSASPEAAKPSPSLEEALRDTAGGLAQEFNNVFTSILTATELIDLQLPEASAIRPKLQVIHKAILRLRRLNQELLSFSQPGALAGAGGIQAGGPSCGQERILLVDDEEVLAALMKQGLQLQGYRVTGRSDSREALDEFRSHPMDFDLLVTDLAMPGMSGVELANCLRKIRPGLPAILVTGVFQGSPSLDGITTPFDAVVFKPFTIEELAQSVRRVMAQRPVQAAAPDQAGPGGPRLLLAEDTSVTRILLRTWLTKAGYQVREARDGQEAWEAWTEAGGAGGIDLVLADLCMPRIGGLDLAARIRAVAPSLPIVLLSTSEDTRAVKDAIHLGVNEYLTKPFGEEVLLQCVRRLAVARGQQLQGLRSYATAEEVRLAHRAMTAVPEQGLPIYSLSEPLTDAGGDVFRCHRVANGAVLFALADVAGHSVTSSYAVAAYLSVFAHVLGECRLLTPDLDRGPRGQQGDEPCGKCGAGPCRPLRYLAKELNDAIAAGPFAEVPICTLFGLWSPGTGQVRLLNAGIPHALWYHHAAGCALPVELDGAPLGILPDPPMDGLELILEPGDRLLMGSDGFFEAQDPEHRPFQAIVPKLWRDLSCTALLMAVNLVSEAARSHAAGNFTDDLLVVGLEQPRS